jgi:transposase-like protein
MPNGPSTQPEGASRPVRRRFSDREKLRILEASDACSRPGEIGLLLRREGIYTSHLANWRRWRMRAHPERVPAGTAPTESQLRHQNARLEREVARLRLKLEHAEKLHLLQRRRVEMMDEIDRDATSPNDGRRA